MGIKVIAKVGGLLTLLISFCFFFSGCASSAVSRDAASNVDLGIQNAKGLVSGAGDTNIADSYQNTNQTTKGALIGGATGAVAGAVSSAIGILPGTAVGAILGASYGKYIDSATTLQDKIENRGVTIVELGDQILIVMPSTRIFDYMTSNVKPQAYSTLEMVAQYINQYTTMLVKVAAYTGVSGSPERDIALSRKQAQNVAKVLLASDVNARVLYAEGYGGKRLVSQNSLGWEEGENYRVEITLEKLYV